MKATKKSDSFDEVRFPRFSIFLKPLLTTQPPHLFSPLLPCFLSLLLCFLWEEKERKGRDTTHKQTDRTYLLLFQCSRFGCKESMLFHMAVWPSCRYLPYRCFMRYFLLNLNLNINNLLLLLLRLRLLPRDLRCCCSPVDLIITEPNGALLLPRFFSRCHPDINHKICVPSLQQPEEKMPLLVRRCLCSAMALMPCLPSFFPSFLCPSLPFLPSLPFPSLSFPFLVCLVHGSFARPLA